MPARILNGVSHAKRVPSAAGGWVDVFATTLTPSIVGWWDQELQPAIDARGLADAGWNWPLLATLARSPLFLPQSLHAVAVGVAWESGFIPCVLLLVARNYPHLPNHGLTSTYLWYLSTAVQGSLQNHLPPSHVPKSLGRLGLDWALTESFNRQQRGRLGLHADLSGGNRLFTWYAKQGMINLPQAARLPLGIRRFVVPNDGRYFYYDTPSAVAQSQSLDGWR